LSGSRALGELLLQAFLHFSAFAMAAGGVSAAMDGPSLFLKTKVCKFDAKGECSRGKACPFAHGQEQVQPRPDFHCTKLCPSFLEEGVCHNKSCNFAHGVQELRRRKKNDFLPTPAAAEEGSSQWQGNTQLLADKPAKASAQKKMCKFHFQGFCTRGSACLFAHQASDLPALCSQTLAGMATPKSEDSTRASSQLNEASDSEASVGSMLLPNVATALFYKTRMCKFHARGVCCKGDLCNFAHKAEELKARPQQEIRTGPWPTAQQPRVLLSADSSMQCILEVKNTFLTMCYVYKAEEAASRKRSKSWPARNLEL